MTASERIYRVLLQAYPARFREVYGPPMAQVFRDCCREAERRAGAAGVARLWLGILGDLAITAIAERVTSKERHEMSLKPLLYAFALFALGLVVTAIALVAAALVPGSSGMAYWFLLAGPMASAALAL